MPKLSLWLRAQPAQEWMPAEKGEVFEAEYGDDAVEHLRELRDLVALAEAAGDEEKLAELRNEVAVLHELHTYFPGVRMLAVEEAEDRGRDSDPRRAAEPAPDVLQGEDEA